MDGRGAPLSLAVTGANRHDVTQLRDLLDGIVVPGLRPENEQHLCADRGYRGLEANATLCDHGYIPHVPGAEEDRIVVLNDPDHGPRRWVVEVAHAWFKRFRKLLVRYEKTVSSHLALLHLAAAIICWRKARPELIYG